MLLCCLRCTLKPSASATRLSRSCTSTSRSATSPTAYRILCLRLAHLVHHAVQRDSAMDPRLDTGGWLTLTKTHYCISSRQGLAPCKICRALPGAITLRLTCAERSEGAQTASRFVRQVRRMVMCSGQLPLEQSACPSVQEPRSPEEQCRFPPVRPVVEIYYTTPRRTHRRRLEAFP